MPGRKKKSASKKNAAAAAPKYSIPPPSPVKTRSSSNPAPTPQSASQPAATPTSPAAMDVPATSSLFSTEISALESKFDARMSQMESNFRATITSALSASSSVPSVVAAPPVAQPAAPVAAAPAVIVSTSRSSSSSSTRSAASRGRSSSSDSSVSRSRDRTRRRRRSSHTTTRKTSRNKHGKYTTLKYVPEHKSIATFERLILANLRMLLKFYKKDRDIKGMLKHSILLAEKADADVFHSEALISYDESVKTLAGEEGITAFSKLDPANIIKHLCYDGTKAARAAKNRGFTRAAAPPRASGGSTSACFKFNFASGGCRRTKCSYPHVCSACSGPGHVNADCPNVDRSHDKANRK